MWRIVPGMGLRLGGDCGCPVTQRLPSVPTPVYMCAASIVVLKRWRWYALAAFEFGLPPTAVKCFEIARGVIFSFSVEQCERRSFYTERGGAGCSPVTVAGHDVEKLGFRSPRRITQNPLLLLTVADG